MVPIDVGISGSASSGISDSGTIGPFIIGGSGGVNQTPVWLFIASGVLVVIALFAFLLKR